MKTLSIVGITLLIIAVIVYIPIGLLYSLNTLFDMGLEYNLQNWFAAFVLYTIVSFATSPATKIK